GQDSLDRLPEDLPHVQIDAAYGPVVIDVVVVVEAGVEEEQQGLSAVLMKQQPLPIEKRVVEESLQVDRTHFDAAHVCITRHVVEVVRRVHTVEDRLERLHPGWDGDAGKLGLGDQLRDPVRLDPLARGERTGGTRVEGRDRRSQLPLDQGAADDLVIDGEAIEVILVEEMPEGAVPDVVQQPGDPQRLLDAGSRWNIRIQGRQVGVELPGPFSTEVHRTQRVLEAGMLAAREDPPGGLQLMDAAKSLQPGMVEQVLFCGYALTVNPFGDLDVAMQRIGHQIDRVVLPGEIVHEFGNILMT